MVAEKPTSPSDHAAWLTPEETVADFAREVSEEMGGMSAEEFIRRLDSGEWDEVIDDPEYRHALMLALYADVVR